MNEQFKEEFKKLNAEEIKDIVNRCGEHNVFVNCNDECFIKYMDNDEYGFWTIQWGMQKVQYMGMNFGCGFFKNSIHLGWNLKLQMNQQMHMLNHETKRV